MVKIFRILVQVEELINNEFKWIIKLGNVSRSESGVINSVADYHGQVSEFMGKLIEGK